MSAPRPDVAVIGAGAFGGWTAFHLQRCGARVALLDAWGAGHPRGTSSGETRILRAVYGEKSLYTEWAWRARELWIEWERNWRVPLFVATGVLWLWEEETAYLRESEVALARLCIPFERLSPAEVARRYPQFSTQGIAFATLEPQGGFLRARLATETVEAQVAEGGGDVRVAAVEPPTGPGPRLERIRLSDGGMVEAGAFVFACGPWLPRMFPELLGSRIVVTKQDVFYFSVPPGDSRFSPGRMPAWADYATEFYGIPAMNGSGFKLANNQGVAGFDPTGGERVVARETLEVARLYLAKRFPALSNVPLVDARVCQYERTPDSHLVIDRHPQYENVWLAGGGSGHGFKLGPAVGEFVARLVLDAGRSSIPAELRLGAVAFSETRALPAKAAF